MKEVIDRSWIETANTHSKDIDKFQNWFDDCKSVEHGYSKGYIDFFGKILTPDIYIALGDPRDKVSLEIGYGGGRLLSAASRVFKKSLGVDIIDGSARDTTASILRSKGIENFSLFNYKNIEEIPENSVDFVYSFIVFQHFSSIQYFYDYIEFISKRLKPDGVGVIYLGLHRFQDFKDLDYIEKSQLGTDFFNERDSTLFFKPEFAIDYMSKYFEVVDASIGSKQLWIAPAPDTMSGQFCVRFKNKDKNKMINIVDATEV